MFTCLCAHLAHGSWAPLTSVHIAHSTSTDPVFSLLRRLQTRHCSHSLPGAICETHAAAVPGAVLLRRPLPSIDICPPGPQQQTRRRGVRCSDGTDRQTGGRKDGRPTVACSCMSPASPCSADKYRYRPSNWRRKCSGCSPGGAGAWTVTLSWFSVLDE